MTKTGKATILDKIDGKFEVKEYPLPEPAPGTVLIKQERCGLCGTDIHVYHGKMPGLGYPIFLGHEFAGTIVALGEGVTSDYVGKPVKVGDRVIVAPAVTCGKCYFCAVAKTPTACENMWAYGFSPNPFGGGYAEYVYLNVPRTTFLKTDSPPNIVALIEPFAVGVHAATRAQIKLGDTVVVQGTGAIGLFCVLCAKMSGAGKVINVGGPSAQRLNLAKKFGADITINNKLEITDPKERVKRVREETPKGRGVDVVFECTGNPAAVPEGLDMLRQSGTYLVVGCFTEAGTVPINPFTQLCNKNINLQGIWGNEIEQWVRILPVLEKREYPYEEMVTHVIGLGRLNEAMELPQKGYKLDGKDVIKVLVDGSKV